MFKDENAIENFPVQRSLECEMAVGEKEMGESCVIEVSCEVADKSEKDPKNLRLIETRFEILKLNRAQLPQLILRSAKRELFLRLFPALLPKKAAFNQASNVQSTDFFALSRDRQTFSPR
jgi:hypothetical protein